MKDSFTSVKPTTVPSATDDADDVTTTNVIDTDTRDSYVTTVSTDNFAAAETTDDSNEIEEISRNDFIEATQTSPKNLAMMPHHNYVDFDVFRDIVSAKHGNLLESEIEMYDRIQFGKFGKDTHTLVFQAPALRLAYDTHSRQALDRLFVGDVSKQPFIGMMPLCIFGEAGKLGKGGKYPSHAKNKAVWDSLNKFFVTFISADAQYMLRVYASQSRGVHVQDVLQFRYNAISGSTSISGHRLQDLKQPWMPFSEAKKLAQNLSMFKSLQLLWDSEALVKKDTFPRMLNCAICMRPVGRSESVFQRHADDAHGQKCIWTSIFACEDCLIVFFDKTNYIEHMKQH